MATIQPVRHSLTLGKSTKTDCKWLPETAVPYFAFKNAGFEVHFVTENGKTPECDKIMLQGLGQKLLVRTLLSVLSTSSWY